MITGGSALWCALVDRYQDNLVNCNSMRRYLIFASGGLSLLIYTVDSTAVAVAFPHFMRELHTNVLWAGWTVGGALAWAKGPGTGSQEGCA